jgi:hypothetical protein
MIGMRATCVFGLVSAASALLTLAACGGGSKAERIPLSELGGQVQLRHSLRNGDLFTYSTQSETSVEGSNSYKYTATVDKQVQVMETGGTQSKLRITKTKAEVVSGDAAIAEKRNASYRKEIGVPVDVVCDLLGSIQNVDVTCSDPEVAAELKEEYASDPALFSIAFPREKLNAGMKWTAVMSFAGIASAARGIDVQAASRVPIEYTFAGAEEQDGRKLAVIEYRIDATIGQTPGDSFGRLSVSLTITASGKARVNVATGMVYDDSYRLEYRTEGLRPITVRVDGKAHMTSGR